jgi:two-component system chemotaxis response regulator CheB
LKTKVLVVDDSLFMRKLISRVIDEDTTLQVVGTAKNGLEAITLTKELKPDVITMDIEMPVMNGLEALIQIMKERPTPVIMLSSLTQEGAAETIEALQSGAIDFISKPSGSISVDLYKAREEIVSKIKAAAQISPAVLQPIKKSHLVTRSSELRSSVVERDTRKEKEFDQIIALGTSTGGPRALDAIIRSLPGSFAFPILVVQHMPPKFTLSLAQRLDRLSAVRVVEAEDNELIKGGTVYIAPGNFHMTVVGVKGDFRIKLHQEAQRSGHRPSVDVLFESVSRLSLILKCHYVILTGMGSDGAKGMLLAKQSGARSTIAEAKETCIVFGMPRSAIEYNCVDYVVPLDKMASKIMDVIKTP